MSIERPKLHFTHSKMTVVEHMERALRDLSWMLRLRGTGQRSIEYTPDWRKRLGYANAEINDTPADRLHFVRDVINGPLTTGLDLSTAHSPSPEELGPAIAVWGLGALRHIQAQEDELGRVRGQLEEEQKRAAGLDMLLTSAHAVVEQHMQEGDRLRESLKGTEATRRVTEQGHAREIADLRVQLEHAQAITKAAESERDAWKTSATSAQDALSMLRAALRIPHDVAEGDVEPIQRHELIRR